MASKTRAARSKRTKEQLLDEMEALEARLDSAEAKDPVAAALAKEAAGKTREAAKGLSVDTIVAKGSTFGLEVQRAVNNLTEQLIAKAEELKTLQEAIGIEQEELQRLYDLDVASASVRALVEDKERTIAELDAQIAEKRKAWQEEQAQHVREVQERNAEIQRQRAREADEYEYRTNTARERRSAEFDQHLRQKKAEHDAAVAVERVALEEQRTALAAERAELDKFRERVNGLEGEIKSKVDAAVAIATNSLKRDLESKFALERKDYEAALGLERQKVAQSESAIASLAADVETLYAQLAAAKQQVTDITIKALESASGQQALQVLRDAAKDAPPARNGAKA